MTIHRFTMAAILLLLLTSWTIPGKLVEVAKEDPKDKTGEKSNFYANPLLLNGKPLDYSFFTTSSQGTLAVVSGNPESEEATKIPFRIYLRRHGAIVQKDASDSRRELYDVDIAPVLALAQPGDELVIEPVRKTDWLARRTILLKSVFSWFWIVPRKGEGC